MLARRAFPTPTGVHIALHEQAKEAKINAWRWEELVDMRALRELEREGLFKINFNQ